MQNILMNLAFYLLVVAAGASFSLQQAANNHLRAELLSPWWAGFISYVGGSLAMLVMALVCRGPGLSWDMLSRTSPFSWTGGILGAIYIATAIFMIPKLGATTVLALMVVGQMLLSLMLDHYGLLHVQVTVRLCHAGLPQLLQHGGAIINVASVASWLPSPQTPLYGPTKAFVRSFSETLALAYRRHGVRVQTLCPGFTVTDFHQRIGLDPQRFYRRYGLLRAYSAEQVVARSLADLAAGRIVSIPGWNYRLLVMLFRHAPMALVHWLLGRSTVARYGAD